MEAPTDHVESLVALGFRAEEAAAAIDRCGRDVRDCDTIEDVERAVAGAVVGMVIAKCVRELLDGVVDGPHSGGEVKGT